MLELNEAHFVVLIMFIFDDPFHFSWTPLRVVPTLDKNVFVRSNFCEFVYDERVHAR